LNRRIDLLGRAGRNQERTAVLGGIGNLGSKIAHCLAKQSFGKLILIDCDRVEYENIGYQEYEQHDIGRSKVEALEKHLKQAYPWVNVESYNMYVANLGGFILSEDELEKQDLQLRKIFSECDCVISSFDRAGPRLTMLMYALIYDKPIIFASAWSSKSPENGLSHAGRINVWKPGLPCPLCYTRFQISEDDGGLYVAHPLIDNIVSSLSAFLAEAILWGQLVYPYITIDLNEENNMLRADYYGGKPSEDCLCQKKNDLINILVARGLPGLLEIIEEAIE